MNRTTLLFDIETLPGEDRQRWEETQGKSVKPRKGEDQADAVERAYRETALDGDFGRIFCIAYCREPPRDGPVNVLWGEERQILEKFWEIARDAALFVGHNVFEFDLKFIYKRSIIHRIRPTRELSFARYRNDPIYDTMSEWERWGRGEGITLERLALALGLPSPKEKMSGAEVWDYYQAGRQEEILDYCKGDVDVLRQVYRRMTFTEAA